MDLRMPPFHSNTSQSQAPEFKSHLQSDRVLDKADMDRSYLEDLRYPTKWPFLFGGQIKDLEMFRMNPVFHVFYGQSLEPPLASEVPIHRDLLLKR